MMTMEEAGAEDLLSFFDAADETLTQTLAPFGGPTPIPGCNASTPEPFYLAGHAQECCGDGERFVGRIAEVLIFARALDSDERDAVFTYLNAKYFSANQPPDGLVCSPVGDDNVDLSWTNHATYDRITIERDGAEIASLPGDATSFQDTGVPTGGSTYDVVATVGKISGGPVCTLGGGGPEFLRGDHDSSGAVDITDSLNRLGFLFLGTTPSDCQEASDFDNSGAVDISDSLNELTFLFLGTVEPPPPGTENCGTDPMEVLPAGGGLPEQANLQLGCEDSFCF